MKTASVFNLSHQGPCGKTTGKVDFTPVYASDWPQFLLNPQHTSYNTSENHLSSTTINSINQGWSFSLYGNTSPIIVNGIVYIASSNNGTTSTIYALKEYDGTMVWSASIPSVVMSTPVVANGIIYIISFSGGNIYAFNALNGTPLWNGSLGNITESSPIVANNVLYVGSGDSRVHALNATTGAQIWESDTFGYIASSPAINNGILYVGANDNKLHALDINTGNQIWSSVTGGAIASSPVIANGKVYVGSDDSKVYAFDANNGSLIWSTPTISGSSIVGSPSVANGIVYIGNGANTSNNKFYALDGSTGNILWQIPVGGNIRSSAAIANGLLYFGASDGKLYIVNSADGTTLKTINTGSTITVSAAVVNSSIYFANDIAIYDYRLPNNAPIINPIASSSISEGGVFSYSGSFSDSDSTSWIGTVDYGDGSGTQGLDLEGSGTNFTLTHTYQQNGSYPVTVNITDNQGATATQTTTVIVNNVPPTISSINSPSSQIEPGSSTSITANFTDPGTLDSHTATIDWGDGNTTNGTVTETNGSGSVSGTHTYTTPGTYTITLTVTDKDGASTSSTTQVIVNAPPTAKANGPYTVKEGSDVTLNGTGTDPDGDTLTYAWDLTGGTNFTTPGQSVTFHGVDGPSPQNVSFQVCDTFGACAVDTTIVTINNVNPTITSLNFPQSPVNLGTAIAVNATFTDPGVLDTHTAVWDWGDGNTQQATIAETNGNGTASGTHTYTAAGVYTVTVTVTDKDGGATAQHYQYVVVYDPSAGFVTGGGTITSPIGADILDTSATGKASFGISAKYQPGQTVPTGSVGFTFPQGNILFTSTAYDWLVVSGNKAYLHGSGTINGTGSYNFLATMIDGSPDTLRVKIKDNVTGTVIYDNQAGAADFVDPTQAIDSGQIKVH